MRFDFLSLADHHEARWALSIGPTVKLWFVTRPISTPPSEGTIGFVDGRDDKGRPKRAVGVFKGGAWRGGKGGGTLRFTPCTWTVAADAQD